MSVTLLKRGFNSILFSGENLLSRYSINVFERLLRFVKEDNMFAFFHGDLVMSLKYTIISKN